MTAPEQARCVYCGTADDLVEDQNLLDLYYCRTCLEKHRRHDQQIERGEAEPPFDG